MPEGGGVLSGSPVQCGGGQVGSSGVYTQPVRQDLAGVFEQDHSVAQQAPALFRMARDDVRGAAVESGCARAARLVGALAASVRMGGGRCYSVAGTESFSTHVASLTAFSYGLTGGQPRTVTHHTVT